MRIKYLLAIVLIALFAVPGTASQLAARAAAQAPSQTGVFSDPDIEPSLSIQLPTRFYAPVITSQPLQYFAG